jgi:pimeloyl-ACP methyl ester carboxylesterase
MIGTINDLYGPIRSFMGHSLGGLALALYLESRPHDSSTRLVLISPPVEMVSAVHMFFQMLELNAGLRKAFDEYAYRLSGRPFSWFSLRRALEGIRAEVLWLHDEDDDITPLADTLPVQKAGHPNVHFVITKGLGHRRIYRDGEVIRQVVAFL